ncbi:MAG TPA: serine/threonine-protein kinase [Candidatus Polarisedimenticolia bacterium]|nr:serine/threonine-protein kinase [Candidatus Polarisedimenticolia bacterium]
MEDASGPAASAGGAQPTRLSHFEILSEIGRGGMGIVYRARDLNLGRNVALKSPHPESLADQDYRRRFLREARAASAISHAHIVPVYEAFEVEGRPWIAMELVEGGDLRDRLATGKPLLLEEIVKHALGIADALGAAHEHHLLHRDIKPSNVLLSKDGRARLTDFGLARRYVRPEEASSLSTASTSGEKGRFAGTPGYMAPEQALGRDVDPRSDLFSFGVLLYEMCTGRPAFPDTDEITGLDAVLHREPEAISRLNYAIPEELERIARKCLAKRPDERYQSAADLLADLRAFQRHLTASRRKVYVGFGKKGVLRSKPFLVALALTALALVIVVAVRQWPRHPVGPLPPAAEPLRIAILAPKSLLAGDERKDWPEVFQAMLADELTGVPGIGVVDPFSLNRLPGDAAGGPSGDADGIRALMTRNRVSWIVNGSILPTGDAFEIRLRLENPKTGEVFSAYQATLEETADLASAASSLAIEILETLDASGAGRPDKSLRPWIGARRRNVAAVRAFLQASRYIHHGESGGKRFLERAVDLDPDFVAPRIWLVSTLARTGDLEEARRHQAKLLELEPKASPFEQAMIGWAGAYIANDAEAQKAHLEVALGYSPGNNILLVNLADNRARHGDCEGAIRSMQSPVAEKWDYPPLYPLWGWCNVMEGHVNEAKAGLMVSHELGDPDPRVYALLQAIALSEGATEEAKRWETLLAERAGQPGAEIEPADFVPIYRKLAEISRAKGLGSVASELERMASPGGPGQPKGNDQRGKR